MTDLIIDFHTHVDEAEAYGWIDPPEKLIPLLDEAGIDMAACMTYVDHPGPNPDVLQYLADACARYPDRLVGFVRLDPNARDEAPRALHTAVTELAYRGLKLHPTTTLAHPAGEATVELLHMCAEFEIPVLFHCGDDPYTTPQSIALAAEAAPETSIAMGHMGGYFHVSDAIEAAVEYDNLYLETSAMPYPAKIKEAVDRIGAHRVLYGSDGPGCNPALEVEKVRIAGLSAADEAQVLGKTAATLLKMEVAT